MGRPSRIVIRNAGRYVQWGMETSENVIGFPRRRRDGTSGGKRSARLETARGEAGRLAARAEAGRTAARAEAGRESGSDDSDGMSVRLEAVAERGDRAAFTELFRHFAPRVRAYLLRGGGDAGGVEDVLQETFATVWRKARLYDRRRASAGAWIFAVARNRRIDAFRRERRPGFDPHDPAFLPGPAPEADQALEEGQRAEAVRAALAALSDRQREVLWLSFYEGESYAAIAVRLGIPLGTVKSRARLAFKRLRRSLAAQREEPR